MLNFEFLWISCSHVMRFIVQGKHFFHVRANSGIMCPTLSPKLLIHFVVLYWFARSIDTELYINSLAGSSKIFFILNIGIQIKYSNIRFPGNSDLFASPVNIFILTGRANIDCCHLSGFSFSIYKKNSLKKLQGVPWTIYFILSGRPIK